MARPHVSPARADLALLLEKARAAHSGGALARAETLYKTILERAPGHPDALHLLGLLNYEMRRPAQALRYLSAAMTSEAPTAELLADHGLVLHALGRTEEALAAFDAALTNEPDNPDLLNKRGVACLNLGRTQEALDTFDRILASDPAHLEALGNRGNTLLKLNRPDEAIVIYDEAIRHHGANAQLLTNRAHALRRLDRAEDALADLEKAVTLAPRFAEAAFELGMVQLSRGDYENGWAAYERRWETSAFAEHRRAFKSPLWTGQQALKGRTILLHAEQGLGDTIQFVRYAERVAERGAKVVLEVQPELRRLMAGVSGVAQVLARGDKLVPFDFHCPLMSLPHAFKTRMATVPARIPYLNVADTDVATWTERLPAGRPRVGICWAGKASHRNDINRSIPLARLARLFDNRDINFISLQFVPSAQDRERLSGRDNVFDFSAMLHDFVDTAGLITQLDLVVTVDTSVAHLAGALGVSAVVLLPFAADFRWLRARDDSPWYPSLKLLRQQQFNDWEAVIEALCDRLDALAGAHMSA